MERRGNKRAQTLRDGEPSAELPLSATIPTDQPMSPSNIQTTFYHPGHQLPKGGGNLIYLGGNQFMNTGPIREFGQVQQSRPPPVNLHTNQVDYDKCHQISTGHHPKNMHPARGDTDTKFIIMEPDPRLQLGLTAGSSPHFRGEQMPHDGKRPSWSIADRTAHRGDPVDRGVISGPTGVGGIMIPEPVSSFSQKQRSPPLENSAEGSKELTCVPTERGPGSNYANEYLRQYLNLPSSSRPVSLASIPVDAAPSTPLRLLAMTAIHDARKPLTSKEICAKLNEAFPGLGLSEDELTTSMKWNPDMRPHHELGQKDDSTCQWTFSIITSLYSRKHSNIMIKDDEISTHISPEVWTDHGPAPHSGSGSVTEKSLAERTTATLPRLREHFWYCF